MTNIVVIPGSWRNGSFNVALAQAAIKALPAGTSGQLESIRDIPMYDGDVEVSNYPDVVVKLKDKIVAADGLLLVSPEYNNSVPGPLKNAIDWLSRPTKDIARVFKGRPVGIIGATIGPSGTRLGQAAWLPIVRVLGMQLFTGGSVYITSADKVFDDKGALTDPKINEVVAKYVQGFAAFVGKS